MRALCDEGEGRFARPTWQSCRPSTHIYDARVHKVGFDGRIFADRLESRRPTIAPSWRTTKRLCTPNLIGVVVLPGPKSSLRASDPVLWGEVVAHSQQDANDEFKRRQQKQVCSVFHQQIFIFKTFLFAMFDLSNPSRLTRLTNIDLKPGDHIVKIDCQIFVSEFIPVLIALVHQIMSRLPFDEGALLNLSPHRSAPGVFFKDAYCDSIEGSGSQMELCPASTNGDHLSEEMICSIMSKLIDNSTLDPIMQLRRDEHFRSQRQEKLETLVKATALDRGQMESFSGALTHPVHCTLG
jgi:hypothetical protein